MSLLSFFPKIWDGITNLFDNVREDLQNAVHIGVVVTEAMKTAVDSPEADILTAIIPGELDDDIKNLLRSKLPAILTELKLADSCTGLTDPVQITACAVKVLQGLDPDVQNVFLHSLSVMIAQVASDGKLTWSDGVHLVEWYYNNKYQTSPAASVAPAVSPTTTVL